MTSQAAEPRALHFLTLGDSYTAGFCVEAAESWPAQLAAALRREGVPLARPLIIARSGWMTDELAEGIRLANPHGSFDLVSLLIGVNNQYRRRGLEEYRLQFRGLLQQAIGFAGGNAGRVLVLSIPDWSATPFAEAYDRAQVAAEIEAFNRANREEAGRAGARYIDLTAASRQAAGRPDLVVEDGLHPSGVMYAEWARLALPTVREILQTA